MSVDLSINRKLQDPFEPSDVEWRAQQGGISGNGKPWVKVIPYITSRAVQQRLDDVFGSFGWKIEQRETNDGKGYICTISVYDEKTQQWISKQDGSEKTNIEPLKGGVSGAMKRAAVQWGIGRYLYNMDEAWAECQVVQNRWDCTGNCHVVKGKNGQPDKFINWTAPILPLWAMPQACCDEYKAAINEACDMAELKIAFEDAFKWAKSFGRTDFLNEFTKLKDEKKAQIQEKLIALSEQSKAEIAEWLDSQVKTLLSVTNESAFNTLKNRITEEVNQKCKDKCVDNSEFIAHIKTIDWRA